MNLVSDDHKYFIMVASPNIITGFSSQDKLKGSWHFDSDRMQKKKNGSLLEKIFFRDYIFYNYYNNFKCINPTILIYNDINKLDQFCFFKPSSNRQITEFDREENNCFACTNPHPISYYLQETIANENLNYTPQCHRSTNKYKSSNSTIEVIKNTNIINNKSNVYLQYKMRRFTVSFVTNGHLKLEFENYFPYDTSKIQALPNSNLNLRTRVFDNEIFFFPKPLHPTSVYGGVILRKSSGLDIINMFLIQNDKNLVLSNLFHSNIFPGNELGNNVYSYFNETDQQVKRDKFNYQTLKNPNLNPMFKQSSVDSSPNNKFFRNFLFLNDLYKDFRKKFTEEIIDLERYYVKNSYYNAIANLRKKKNKNLVNISYESDSNFCRRMMEMNTHLKSKGSRHFV